MITVGSTIWLIDPTRVYLSHKCETDVVKKIGRSLIHTTKGITIDIETMMTRENASRIALTSESAAKDFFERTLKISDLRHFVCSLRPDKITTQQLDAAFAALGVPT